MEAQANSFLNLPAHYGTKVSDMVYFTFVNPDPSSSTQNDITAGPGTLLVSKIADGLRNWGGYGDDDIAKVAGLVARNVYSCHSRQVRGEVQRFTTPRSGEDGRREASLWDVPRLAVEFMLRGLLDTAVSRDVHVNSNEPVLLINFEGEGDVVAGENGRMTAKQRDMLNYVTNIAVTEAQDRWGICPVRVYAGRFLPTEEGSGEGDEHGDEAGHTVPSFSLTLLNVVNTDIGGPSMPQLLDAPCNAAEWARILRKEVWRGRELVSQEENADLFEPHVADDASEHSFGSADDAESVGSDADRLLVDVEDVERRGDLHEIDSDASKDGDVQREASAVDESQRNDAPQSSQLSDRAGTDNVEEEGHKQDLPEEWTDEEEEVPEEIELPVRHIEHPSWDRHDDGTSLLDLIRSQASIIAPFGTETAGHGVPDLEGNVGGPVEAKAQSEDNGASKEVEAAAIQEKQTQAKSSSEDDFVVV